MKKITLLIYIIVLVSSCSTSKIESNSWVSEDFKPKSVERMLIFANTEDTSLQSDFENKTSEVLSKKGITTVTMHELFPQVKYQEERSPEEINAFIVECKNKNIDKILFASQKSITVDTVLTKSLHNYMNSLKPLELGKTTSNEKVEYDTKKITTYTIEVAIYNINTTINHQPIAKTEVKATNPKSVKKLKEYIISDISKLFDFK